MGRQCNAMEACRRALNVLQYATAWVRMSHMLMAAWAEVWHARILCLHARHMRGGLTNCGASIDLAAQGHIKMNHPRVS